MPDEPPRHRRPRIHTPPWQRLGERTRMMLQWVNATLLLREADLLTLVWPEPVSHQTQGKSLARWQQQRYIQLLLEAGERCYQLDRVGVQALRNAGFAPLAPAQRLDLRVRPGVLLTNRVGASLFAGARHDGQVSGVAWRVRPFSGAIARPDGVAVVQYRVSAQAAGGEQLAPWLPELVADGYVPPPGHAVQRLNIEIDRGTESQRQLIQRAQGWRAHWEATPQPAATHTLFLWITTGCSERLNTIWTAWVGHAFLPALFTTVRDLAADGTQWHPWEPLRFMQERYRWIWRDLYGRPRSLKPWEMNEPRWRAAALHPVTLPSLTASIAAWDQACPAPGY